MRPERIDQIVHILAHNDAIGTHVLYVRDVLRRAGFASDIYAGAVHPELKHESRAIEDLPLDPAPRTWALFHHSIGSPVAEAVLKRSGPLVIDYHNITPARLVDRWAPWVREELELGVEQLGSLAPRCFFGIVHSVFSEDELHRAGCKQTAVVPPLFSLENPGAAPRFAAGGGDSRALLPPLPKASPDPAALARLGSEKADGGRDWLFVGRISPHKAQHDLIKALVAGRDMYHRNDRLHLVGTSLGVDYKRSLERFAARLGVGDAVRIAGVVAAAVLSAYYESADVFVCTSEHEGFCVPIVEAMSRGVPVVAFDAAAVGETVGGAGVVVGDKSPVAFAASVNRVMSDPELARRLVSAGHDRAERLSMPRSGAEFIGAIEDAVKVASECGIGR